MPKRSHIEEDVDEGVATPSSKRARNSGNDSDSEDPQGPSQTQAKGKGRASRAQESEDEDEGRDKRKDEDMDDEQFENIYGERLRVTLEKKRRTQSVSCLVNWV